MPTTCAHTKPNGDPCAARPLPNSDFCLFHDPAHQQSHAESRSKGGSTPRRRFRRFPRLLDHMQVAELLGELFVDSLNDPAAIDTQRLRALTALSRVLLKAVGTPPTFLIHADRREPHPSAGHLLRVYPPIPPEVEADLLAAEPPSESATQPPPPADSPQEGIITLDAGDGDAWYAAAVYLPLKESPAPAARPTPPAPGQPGSLAASPGLQGAAVEPPGPAPAAAASPGPSEWEQALELARSQRPTRPSPVDRCCARLLAALNARPPAKRAPATLGTTAAPPTPDAVPSAPPAVPHAAAAASPDTQLQSTPTPESLNTEQVRNRPGTGLPGTSTPLSGEQIAHPSAA